MGGLFSLASGELNMTRPDIAALFAPEGHLSMRALCGVNPQNCGVADFGNENCSGQGSGFTYLGQGSTCYASSDGDNVSVNLVCGGGKWVATVHPDRVCKAASPLPVI